jgi:hypothetical protein
MSFHDYMAFVRPWPASPRGSTISRSEAEAAAERP